MHLSEASDLADMFPLIDVVLRKLEAGERIGLDDPLYETYLAVRQRGLVHRVGEQGERVVPSPRADEYRAARLKK